MSTHMDTLDLFLNSKDSLFKDEGFDILGGETWNLDDDKFLESIRYGDKLDDEVQVTQLPPQITSEDSSEMVDLDLDTSEVLSYTLAEEVLSPASSASGSSSSGDHSEDQNHSNVKVVQLVGILPAGVKAIQILQQDDNIIFSDEILDASSSGSSDQNAYQELKLSDEEKRLLTKEGVTLPTHYPLSKFEERELKRIRRKIRNKISAQDSRKRKKEFLDTLQQRLQEVEDEKSFLSKKVRTLELTNAKLSAQVKRLTVALSSHGKQVNPATTNHPNAATNRSNVSAATTLLVLILSLALVVLPTMQGKKQSNADGSAMKAAFEDSNPNTSMAGRSRTMLGVMPAKVGASIASLDDEWKDDDIDEPLLKIPRFSFHQSLGGIGNGKMLGLLRNAELNPGLKRKLAHGKDTPTFTATNKIIDEIDV